MDGDNNKPDYSMNLLVFYVLVVMTIGEYLMGVIASGNIIAFMMSIAILKAYFIVAHYMHIGKVFASDEEAH